MSDHPATCMPGVTTPVTAELLRGTVELVALRTDAPVTPLPRDGRRVWLHHGSSISQGSNAEGPTGTWPAHAAARAEVELVNLGFSGSAMLDPFVARTMRDLAADLISVEIGINLVGHDVMRLHAFTPAVHGFLDTVREGHPTLPLLVVSPILCPIHEDTPGPGAFDVGDVGDGVMQFRATRDPAEVAAGKLTLRVVRDELVRIVEQRSATDPHLHLLDGRALYGDADAVDLPLPDHLHPDAPTHRLIGDRFAAHAFAHGGPFAPFAEPDRPVRRGGSALPSPRRSHVTAVRQLVLARLTARQVGQLTAITTRIGATLHGAEGRHRSTRG